MLMTVIEVRLFNCRLPGSVSLQPLVINGVCYTRAKLYCPGCEYQYQVAPCPFRPPKTARPAVPRTRERKSGNIFGQVKMGDDELLACLVALWRELGRPPTPADVGGRYHTLCKRFGGKWRSVLEYASRLLTEEERATLVWRCPHCGRADFKNGRGWQGHIDWCRSRAGGEVAAEAMP